VREEGSHNFVRGQQYVGYNNAMQYLKKNYRGSDASNPHTPPSAWILKHAYTFLLSQLFMRCVIIKT